MAIVRFVGKTKRLDEQLLKAESIMRSVINTTTSGDARTHRYYSQLDKAYGIIGDVRSDMVHDGARMGKPKKTTRGIIMEY